jgi:hypothetical protein
MLSEGENPRSANILPEDFSINKGSEIDVVFMVF